MEKKKKFLPKAEYPGGMKAMSTFIDQHMLYPETALRDRVEGMVSLRLTINYQGHVDEVQVLKSLQSDCDEEAVRLGKLLIFHVARVRDVRIRCYQKINIHFRLPVPKDAKLTLNYEITTKNQGQEQVQSDYNYRIVLK